MLVGTCPGGTWRDCSPDGTVLQVGCRTRPVLGSVDSDVQNLHMISQYSVYMISLSHFITLHTIFYC